MTNLLGNVANNFKVISSTQDTIHFINDVQKAADEHRNSLGFFPKSVYEEFSRRGYLYVLVETTPNGYVYAGHLLFDCTFPRAKIVQMFTLQKYRRKGLATKLIFHLREFLTRNSFISIYARVAEDLIEANAYWDRQRFYIQRIEEGGATRKRKILVRCHELESPQLFPSSGISANNPLGLATSTSSEIPLYLLDLNVLFDLSPRRSRHEEAASLFQAERMNYCRLAISTEIQQELQRTAYQGKTDPMQSFINIFPTFPLFCDSDSEALLGDLASIIFPERNNKDQLSENDKSDLRHVATVIQRNLAGLITNDRAILEASETIMHKFGVEVISPSAFILDEHPPSGINHFETLNNSTLSLREISNAEELNIHELLLKLKLPGSVISSGWLPSKSNGKGAASFGVWDESKLVGYLSWSPRDSSGCVVAHIAVDETKSHSLSASRILLIYLLEKLSPNGPIQVRLELPPHQSYIREIASGFGFSITPDQNGLSKVILGGVLTCNTWNTYQEKLAKKSKIKLPLTIPTYRSIDQQIQIKTPDGNQTHITLDSLETLLSPALFCLPGRPAVITPVQRSFSEALLGHSRQQSLLPMSTASLFQDRHYLSSSRTIQYFKSGTLILFYESSKKKGRSEVVAIARVRQAFLKPSNTFGDSDLVHSVLTAENLSAIGKSKMKTVTVFDNIYPIPHPVPLSTLQRIGCGGPNDLISTHPISDTQLQEILREAF